MLLIVGREQGLDPGVHARVARRGFFQIRRPLAGSAVSAAAPRRST